jgi:hypothetical protein
VQVLVGLRVRCVRDVLQPVGGGRHVVSCSREVQGAGSPHAGIVIIAGVLRNLLPRKVLPLALELYLSSLQVHLLSS